MSRSRNNADLTQIEDQFWFNHTVFHTYNNPRRQHTILTAGIVANWRMVMLEDGLLGFGGQQFQNFHTDDGVALRIQTGTPHGYGIALGVDGGNASAHTALARQTYEVGELARFIVEAAGLHDGIHTFYLRRGELYLAEDEGTAVVGKG